MKNKLVLFTVSCLLLAIIGCHAKAKRAKKYHTAVFLQVQTCIDSSLNFADGILTYNKDIAEEAQMAYTNSINRTINTIEFQGDFEGDTTLSSYSLEILHFYKNTLQSTFEPFINSITDSVFSESQIHIADSLISKFTMTESLYWERLNWADKKFIKENEIDKLEP